MRDHVPPRGIGESQRVKVGIGEKPHGTAEWERVTSISLGHRFC